MTDISYQNSEILQDGKKSEQSESVKARKVLVDNRKKQSLMQTNQTGLPDQLKAGMESVTEVPLDHVKVHYHSSKPAQIQAHAYAQGNEIHLASGKEEHLAHELGHVVQQARGQVKANNSVAGMPLNDNQALEDEATRLGNQALQRSVKDVGHYSASSAVATQSDDSNRVVQRELDKADWEAIHGHAKNDLSLQQIVAELFKIYSDHKGNIKYGESDKGGHAGFDKGNPIVSIVKETNFLGFSKLDVERQAAIIHELTHLAEAKANNKNSLDYTAHEEYFEEQDEVDKEKKEPNPKKNDLLRRQQKLEEWTSNDDLKGYGSRIAKLAWNTLDKEHKSFSKNELSYLEDRMKYVNSMEFTHHSHEYATVFTELYYYMKAKKLTNSKFYKIVQSGALTYFSHRNMRRGRR